MGRTVADVRALVLTHGHSDHIGFAEKAPPRPGVPVTVHEMDAALARGEVPNPSKGFGPIKLGPLFGFLWFTDRCAVGFARRSSTRSPPSATVRPWTCRGARASS
jgi:glyoxylase-like metal-dependent hydrolase (beta-lactamase superfamily II)